MDKRTHRFLSLLFVVITGTVLAMGAFLSAGAQVGGLGLRGSWIIEKPALESIVSPNVRKLLENARDQMGVTKRYQRGWIAIGYPMGDVPPEVGVCSDVVVRAFRAAGVDLQKAVHEDMRDHFSAYPKKWGLSKTDKNIDHRRVPNLQTFFTRKGRALLITRNAKDYAPGDVVAWDLNGNGLTHIGVVSNMFNERTQRHLIVHNIGSGTVEEDRLFEWRVIGHYRYF